MTLSHFMRVPVPPRASAEVRAQRDSAIRAANAELMLCGVSASRREGLLAIRFGVSTSTVKVALRAERQP